MMGAGLALAAAMVVASPGMAGAVDRALLDDPAVAAAVASPAQGSAAHRWSGTDTAIAWRTWDRPVGPVTLTVQAWATAAQAQERYAQVAGPGVITGVPVAILGHGPGQAVAAVLAGRGIVSAACAGDEDVARACAVRLVQEQAAAWASADGEGSDSWQLPAMTWRQGRQAVLPARQAARAVGMRLDRAQDGSRGWIDPSAWALPGSAVAYYSWPGEAQAPVPELVSVTGIGPAPLVDRAWETALGLLRADGWHVRPGTGTWAWLRLEHQEAGVALAGALTARDGNLVLAACSQALRRPWSQAQRCAERLALKQATAAARQREAGTGQPRRVARAGPAQWNPLQGLRRAMRWRSVA